MALWFGGVDLWKWKFISYCYEEYAQLLLSQRKGTKIDHCYPLWMPWGMEGVDCTKQQVLLTLSKKNFLLSLLEYWTKWISFLTKTGITLFVYQPKYCILSCFAFHSSEVWFVGFCFQYSVLIFLVFLDKYFNIPHLVRHNQKRHIAWCVHLRVEHNSWS